MFLPPSLEIGCLLAILLSAMPSGNLGGAIHLFEFWRNRCHPCDCRPRLLPSFSADRLSSKEGGPFPLARNLSNKWSSAKRCTPCSVALHTASHLVDLRHSRAPGGGAGSLFDNASASIRILVRGDDVFYINHQYPPFSSQMGTSYLDGPNRINLKRFRPSSKLSVLNRNACHCPSPQE